MKVVADENGSVVVPTEAPGHRFDVEFAGPGRIVLTLEAGDRREGDGVRLVRTNGKLFGTTGAPIDERALAEALREVP